MNIRIDAGCNGCLCCVRLAIFLKPAIVDNKQIIKVDYDKFDILRNLYPAGLKDRLKTLTRICEFVKVDYSDSQGAL